MPSKAPQVAPRAQAQLNVLGSQLRARRKALGISASAAAEAAGVSRVTWYRIEKGLPSVAAGAYANAAQALGTVWACVEPGAPAATRSESTLPLHIRLADYPQLRKLAWQMPGDAVLAPREALSLYEREARHFDAAAVQPHEQSLIDALRAVFDTPRHGV